MANTVAFLSDVTVQVLTQSSGGVNVQLTQAVAQLLTQGTPKRTQVSQLIAQILVATTPKRIEVAQLIAQILIQNAADSGGSFYTSNIAGQVVWTVGIPDIPRQRAWTYTLDGHYFYCLDLGANGTHVYDLSTQQWTEYDTVAYEGHFNFKNGSLWKAGKRVVGGDILTGAIYEMLPTSFLDDGWRPAEYEVRGAIFAQGISKRKNFALRLIGSTGRLGDDIAPVMNMKFSDDLGASWSNEYQITLTTDTKQRIEWRSLGSFAAPGRIFRLYDTGGVKFIGWVEAEVE